MKNNTVRAHHHGGKNPAASQAERQAPAAAVFSKHYALALIEWFPENLDKHVTMGEIDLPAGDFEILEKESLKRADASFTKLLKVGYAAMFNAYTQADLEDATRQSNALLMLLIQTMDYERLATGGFCSNGKDSETLNAGLLQLVWETQKRLVNASHMEVAS